MTTAAAPAQDLVLVGGGHAHVQVIRRWMMRPLPRVQLTLVVDRAEAVYSGMVPGLAAGDYATPELEIDLVPLARRAGARVLLAPAVRVDPGARRIELDGRPSIPYDVASLDVGSSLRGLERPGVAEHALATRPIRDFVDRLARRLAALPPGEPCVAVVGGGAAGLELAFTLEARLRGAGQRPRLVLVHDGAELLPGHPAAVVRRVRREAQARDVRLLLGCAAERVEKDGLWLAGEAEPLACQLVLWATGAAPPALLGASPLPLDARGFVRVAETLEVPGCEGLFAVGDCAALDAHPWLPKAGVYAVRQGPVLDANLRARLAGGGLRRYRPQRDFLMLLNLGERRALGAKWGIAVAGPRVWRLKDRIDRRFVERFRVLETDGAPASGFPSPESMGGEEMPCGGCAAKVEASSLARALARLGPPPRDASVLLGLEQPDDAAAVRLPRGDVVLATLDGFRAFSDDPWLVGRVAAVNALSDVLAKGGRPRHALAWVGVPEEDPARAEEALYQVLAGVRAALDPLGVSLVGGHSTQGRELLVGLAVTGELGAAGRPLPLAGARPGQRLLLSKPLGTGVVLAADMRGLARGSWLAAAVTSMLRPNVEAARVATACEASACTDVSGFGLAGHLGELLRASGAGARLRLAALPALPGARQLLGRGVRSSYHAQNALARRTLGVSSARADAADGELLFDPQTSGGLLFAVPESRAESALLALREAGDPHAAIVGVVTEPAGDGALLELE